MSKKILITSVGSLVGQNILDALEGRRNNIKIIGTNSVANTSNNYRCDSCYLVGKAINVEQFKTDLLAVIEKEKPDVIIVGRDDDVAILAELSEKFPKIKEAYIGGSLDFAKSVDDKVLSYHFGDKHNLPFANTVESGKQNSIIELTKMVDKYNFPLIAKPQKGNGSRGIWIVTENKQLEKIALIPGYSIQPFFRGDEEEMIELDTTFGLPFFWEIPETSLFAAQVIINKQYQIEEICTFVSLMVNGKCEKMNSYASPELKDIVNKFAEAAIIEGWRGPFNIQFKKDAKYGFQAIEMNGRFTGGTSARLYFGFDEVGRAINDWTGSDVIPPFKLANHVKVVEKILKDYPIEKDNVDSIIKNKFWDRKI